jgi:spore maturation protein CgeB
MTQPLDIVILGLSVTSSWGNGHATTYRSLIRGLAARGHRVLFLERDTPWYAGNRDEPHPPGARTELYESFDDLTAGFEREIADADVVIVGSFVPEGTRVGEWVTAIAKGTAAFYDIDTPVTLAKLAEGCREYLTPQLIARYGLYLSFTGGPVLRHIERRYGAPIARPLYCSADPNQYRPQSQSQPWRWDLGYLGTYSDDRQPMLDRLLLEPARQWNRGSFTVAGPLYPKEIQWPANVDREIHLSPREHPSFYGSQRFTLNVTREAMKQAGYSPSVRLFEAGACGAPILSDWWEGLDSIFEIGTEVLISADTEETLRILREYPEARRLALGEAGRRRILAEHTPEQRAVQLEGYLREVHDNFYSHPARRNGRGRQINHGVGSGLAPQRERETAGGEDHANAPASSNPRDLHEPAGAGH